MNVRSFYLLGLFLLGVLQMNAQELLFTGEPDRVGLDNWMVIEGEIKSYRPGDHLVIDRGDGFDIVVKEKDIWFIRQNEKRPFDFPADFYLMNDLFPDSLQIMDALHLTNGKVLNGKIVSYTKGKTIAFKPKKGPTIYFDDQQIDHIEQEVIVNEREQKKLDLFQLYEFKERGMYLVGAFTGSFSRTFERFQTGVGVHAILGYQHNLRLGTGIGIGYDTYRFQGAGESYIPVFAELRSYLFRQIKAPYVFLIGGYGFPAGSRDRDIRVVKFQGGWMMHPGVGFRLGGSGAQNFTFDVGVKFQNAYLEREFVFNGDFEKRTINYRRFTARLGMVF